VTTLIKEVYDAFRAAGTPEDQAAAAAQAIAGYENRFADIERELVKIRGELNILKWMVGFNLAISMALLWKVFTP